MLVPPAGGRALGDDHRPARTADSVGHDRVFDVPPTGLDQRPNVVACEPNGGLGRGDDDDTLPIDQRCIDVLENELYVVVAHRGQRRLTKRNASSSLAPAVVRLAAEADNPLGFAYFTPDELTDAGYELAAMGWPIVPEAFSQLLTRVARAPRRPAPSGTGTSSNATVSSAGSRRARHRRDEFIRPPYVADCGLSRCSASGGFSGGGIFVPTMPTQASSHR